MENQQLAKFKTSPKFLAIRYSAVCLLLARLYDYEFLLSPVQSMVFITLLLFTVTYIFAIAGVIFFESYTRSNRQDLEFHQSFRFTASRVTLLYYLITLVTPSV